MSLNQVAYIQIHPGIGLARVGNSPEHFIGPEAPGVLSDPGGSGGPGPDGGNYKDSNNLLKRQAQRYRIYGYDKAGNVVTEIDGTTEGVASVEWKVHVRNMKAANYAFEGIYLFDPEKLRNPSIQPDMDPIDRDKLIIDPKPQTITFTAGSPPPASVPLTGKIFEDVGPGKLPGYLRFNPSPGTPPSQDVEVVYEPATVGLGALEVDDQGRLLFVPGPGESASVTLPRVEISNPSENESFDPPPPEDNPLVNEFSYFNVPGWYDDTCGGSIDATVTLADGRVLSTLTDPGKENESRDATRGAWVVVAPPKFAPAIWHVVPLLAWVYENFPEADPNHDKPTVFYRDIFPILAQATNHAWVSDEAFAPHGPKGPGNLLSPANMEAFTDPSDKSKDTRMRIFNILRHPDSPPPPPPQGPVTSDGLMPKLWGMGGKPEQNQRLGLNLPNQFLTLTEQQLRRMKEWAEGHFTVGEPFQPQALDQLPLSEQPRAMDTAALQPTVAGNWHPGIEFPYLIMYTNFFADAFRVAEDVEPGSLAAYMASPWQGDFWSCNTAWWPAQRPDIAVVKYEDGERYKRDWFRGYTPDGTPLSSTDGYDQMVSVWWQLGMVVQKFDDAGNPVTDNGEFVFVEAERDPALDEPPTDES